MLELLLVPAYAVADAFAGGSLGGWAKRLDDKLPGRAAFWGALLVALVGLLAIGPWGAAIGLVWLIYRTPGWRIFGGSATPVGIDEIAGTLARHMIALLALVVVYWAKGPLAPAAMIFVAYAVFATILAAWYGQRKADAFHRGEPIREADNTTVEVFRGAAFGAAVAAVLVFGQP